MPLSIADLPRIVAAAADLGKLIKAYDRLENSKLVEISEAGHELHAALCPPGSVRNFDIGYGNPDIENSDLGKPLRVLLLR
jgi:hypothetical protein